MSAGLLGKEIESLRGVSAGLVNLGCVQKSTPKINDECLKWAILSLE